jgi:lipopolysaccharide biosynthesis glycosyltransferase
MCVGSCFPEDAKLYERIHYTKEMYYRLLIPKLLKEYEKVLYLDSDIVVKDDISKLYDIDIDGFTLGAIKNFTSGFMAKYVINDLKIDTAEYFNSGVLLIDTAAFERNEIRDTCLELLKEHDNLMCPDQDILNISCRGKVLFIEQDWNFPWHHLHTVLEEYYIDPQGYERYMDVKKQARIIHFTSGIKPWARPDKSYSEWFWSEAKDSIFYEEILFANIKNLFQKT